MGLQDIYKRFLAYPAGDALAADASLHYLPTLTSINEPLAILKHYTAQDQLVKKKDEKFLNVVENNDSLCIETETTIQFLINGGAYLPGLDDNFLADKVVTLPMIHIVTFNNEQKINQIRLFWDQGSLLKTVEVIGTRGRNWPVRDSKDVVRLVQTSISASSPSGSEERTGRRQSRVGANGDPHNSLSLFKNRELPVREESLGNEVAPRQIARPAPRDYHDLFAADADAPADRSPSPKKNVENPVKSGAGKHFPSNRLFDDTPADPVMSPKKSGTNQKQYEHFEFGETQFVPKPATSKASKHASQWGFEDFETPLKPKQKRFAQNERHFGWSDDEEEASKPNVYHPYVPKPRHDAAPHFEFTDKPTEAAPKGEHRPYSSGRSRMASHANDLYEDHVTGGEQSAPDDKKMPLGNITNQAGHRKNFSSQFEIQDDSPGAGTKDENHHHTNQAAHRKNFSSQFEIKDNSPNNTALDYAGRHSRQTEPMKKAINVMNSNWSLYDESPYQNKNQGIKTAGDGMGGKKGGEKGWWEYDE